MKNITDYTILAVSTPRYQGIAYGITAPTKGEYYYRNLFGYMVFDKDSYLSAHAQWRENNSKSDKILRKKFGENYWL